MVDTLRADHLGCYGYERPTSPNIDRFADDGILFKLHVVQGTWTKPSVASLLSGVHQRVHGGVGREDVLKPSIDIVSETLKEHGYSTGFITSNGNISEAFGFEQGFDLFTLAGQKEDQVNQSSKYILEEASSWLSRERDNSFFLYLHISDPHNSFYHGQTVYSENSNVPLIIKLPGQKTKGKAVGNIVQSIDVLPTIYDLLGIPIPELLYGQSLLPLIFNEEGSRGLIYTETDYIGFKASGIIDFPWKLIIPRSRPSRRTSDNAQIELYRIDNDPSEACNLRSVNSILAGYLQSK